MIRLFAELSGHYLFSSLPLLRFRQTGPGEITGKEYGVIPFGTEFRKVGPNEVLSARKFGSNLIAGNGWASIW